MKSKKCTKCEEIKPLDEFCKHKGNKDGHSYWCKECRKKPIKPKLCEICGEEFKVNSNFQKYCEKCSKIVNKKYYEDNKEKIKEYKKKYKQNNKEKIKKYKKEWYQRNKEYIKKCRKEYYEKNKNKINKFAKKYISKKRKKDINFRITDSLRHRVYMALKNNWKSATTAELVGCSVEYLKKYIESLFKKGMTWDNYGKWHIDHIRPCASFDLSKESEQRKCFNYKNLQPLWASENIKKSNKY